jgi:hypothetical protein
MKTRISLIILSAVLITGVAILRHSNLLDRQYPISVQFAAPHLSAMDSFFDRLWFQHKSPQMLRVAHAACPPVYYTCQKDASYPCVDNCTAYTCFATQTVATCTTIAGCPGPPACPDCK